MKGAFQDVAGSQFLNLEDTLLGVREGPLAQESFYHSCKASNRFKNEMVVPVIAIGQGPKASSGEPFPSFTDLVTLLFAQVLESPGPVAQPPLTRTLITVTTCPAE